MISKISVQGFTLIEMIVVIVILSIVSAISIIFLIDSLKIHTMTENQKTLLDEGKLALERMCRDIRDARSIASPSVGGSGNLITFTRTNATAQDSADEIVTFLRRAVPKTLVKIKSTPSAESIMAENVSTFTVTRGTTDDEITLLLTLSLTSGETVTLQTKVYPKNLDDSATYKNFFQNWQEELSS